jgi:bacteriorhodopsin
MGPTTATTTVTTTVTTTAPSPRSRDVRDDDTVVLRSARCSVLVQALFALPSAIALFLPLRSEDDELRAIAALDLASQCIEFAYYAAAVGYFGRIRTWTRYIDWFVSTPVMLLSFLAFYVHRTDGGHLGTVFEPDRAGNTVAILLLNHAMLSCGLVYELRVAPRWGPAVLLLGTALFLAESAFILNEYVAPAADALSNGIFVFVFVVWGAYAVAAAMPYRPKNVAYNTLDIVSKNFYGIFVMIYVIAR